MYFNLVNSTIDNKSYQQIRINTDLFLAPIAHSYFSILTLIVNLLIIFRRHILIQAVLTMTIVLVTYLLAQTLVTFTCMGLNMLIKQLYLVFVEIINLHQ